MLDYLCIIHIIHPSLSIYTPPLAPPLSALSNSTPTPNLRLGRTIRPIRTPTKRLHRLMLLRLPHPQSNPHDLIRRRRLVRHVAYPCVPAGLDL